MLQFDGTKPLPPDLKKAVVIIGNFDGVHLGHSKIIETAKTIARQKNLPIIAITFEPHPRSVFAPDSPLKRLTPPDLKAMLLQASGVAGLVVLQFTKTFASIEAKDFIKKYLCEYICAAHVVVGFNFYFGKNKGGSPEFLQAQGKKLGFETSIVDKQENIVDKQEHEKLEIISSSAIRDFLQNGNFQKSIDMLGYHYLVGGEVIKGKQLGRTLGFPTANIKLPNSNLAHGIYAVKVHLLGKLYNGVASFGRRPTFDEGEPLFETFIFNFDKIIYGKTIYISLFAYLRGEKKFANGEELKTQMKLDEQQAKDILQKAKPLSKIDEIISFKGQ